MTTFPKVLYGHRGAPVEQPENTLPSFRRALEVGATALETDVWMTADWRIVVSHDPTGMRMANLAQSINQCRLDEVQSWDVGWGYLNAQRERPFVGTGYRIPTLEALLVEFAGIRINVDVKQSEPEILSVLLPLLKRHRAEDHVRLASFRSSLLREIRRRGYPGETGLGRTDIAQIALLPSPFLKHRKFGNAAQIPRKVGPISLDTQSFINKCHRLGIRVDYWTINSPEEARQLWNLGADGIMTDDPAHVASALKP